jgi:UDP-N-acetylmuramoyl-tripeptide--D-alanyl-D-alanine ligase
MILYSDLAKIKGEEVLKKRTKLSFKYVCIDSRKANKDELFFALKGENHDAHQYLTQVFESGCSLAVVNRSWHVENGENFPKNNFYVVDDTTLALGELASIHKKRLKIKTLVVGGSNGKTTTKEMLACVLSKKFKVLFTAGNFNNHIGVPLTLLRLNEKHNFCVLEIGCNHFNEIKYLCKIAEPDYGIITNIGKEHLEFFKNKSGVAKAEFELLDWFENAKGKKIFFANLDDDYIFKKSHSLKRTKVIGYSYKHKSNYNGLFKGYTPTFNPVIEVKGKNIKNELIEINAFGKHSIYNGLAAASIGITLGVNTNEIKNALVKFVSGSGKRMEVIKKENITLVNDTYNSNPDSVLLGLATIAELETDARKHIVLGDMLELGKSSLKEHGLIGRQLRKHKLNYLYTFGPDSEETSKSAGNLLHNKHYKNKSELVKELKKNLQANDVVYVKGSRGMKMEEIVNNLVD